MRADVTVPSMHATRPVPTPPAQPSESDASSPLHAGHTWRKPDGPAWSVHKQAVTGPGEPAASPSATIGLQRVAVEGELRV